MRVTKCTDGVTCVSLDFMAAVSGGLYLVANVSELTTSSVE